MGVKPSPAFFISGSDYKLRLDKAIVPNTTDGASLGTTSLNWSDLFLDSGAVINFDSGDVLITHSANTLTFSGVTGDYNFDDTITVNNPAGFAGRDTAATKAELLVANASNDAHFLANIGNGNILDEAFGGFNSDVAFTFGGECCGGGLPTAFTFNTSGNVEFKASSNLKVRMTTAGNVKIGGTANRGTTEGTFQLVLFDGTAPVGTLANGVSLYSASGELRSMDAAGNSTLLSPHDHKTNEWIFHSKDTNTGKVLRIDMERLMRKLDKMFGGGFIQEFVEA